MPTQIGTAGLIAISSAWVYDPATGSREVKRWKGDHAAVKTAYDAYIGSGVRATIEPSEGTPKSILVVEEMGGVGTDDPDADVEVVWTLMPVRQEASLWHHPDVRAITTSMTNDGLKQFHFDVESVLNPPPPPAVVAPFDIATLGPTLEACVRQLIGGNETYTRAGAVLRKTRTVSASTSLSRDLNNVERVFTTAQLVFDENIPNAILSTLEDGSWLKTFGGVEQLTDGRFQLTVEWDYAPTGGWPTPFPYSVAT